MHGQRQLQRGTCEEHGHKIGVHVACRPPVLIPAGEVLNVRQSPASKLWDGKLVHLLILPLQRPTYCTTCRCMHTNVEDIELQAWHLDSYCSLAPPPGGPLTSIAAD